ncbi:MAG: SagB family peptide dehydrogenase [Chloroflexi bacterium]|nr:SagB family peptide dehydrogenase [Chloroflexota bacterium]
MGNRDLQTAWEYHNGTKHSYASVRAMPHVLPWDIQPRPYKVYTTLPPMPLPTPPPPSGVPALAAVSSWQEHGSTAKSPDLPTLASILHLSAGITKKVTYPSGEMYFRAAACTGALYHIELYVVCGDLPDMEAGVYHFSVPDASLRRLRTGDYRSILVEASGGQPAAARAPAMLLATDTFWRNSWKYQARAYRHTYWDTGTILANLLAMATAYGLPAQVAVGFVDSVVNRLLGVDGQREAAVCVVPLGSGPAPSPATPPELPPLRLETAPISKTEVDYPAIRAMHAASALTDAEEATAWRAPPPTVPLPDPSGRLFLLEPLGDDEAPSATIEQAILRRGSSRRFAREPISFRQLSTVLHRATQGIPADFLEPTGALLNHLYLVVNAVDGLPSGAYVFHRDQGALELLRAGDFRREAGYIALEQPLAADASADVFLLTDLNPLLQRFGNRGYRAAQLEGGILGGKLYLAAYALGLGATGLTFYDDEVTAFFSPHAQGKSAMFLVALGRPARRRALSQPESRPEARAPKF